MDRGRPAGAIGIAWYARADYRRVREVMVDRDRLPTTFDRWRRQAEGMEAEIARNGDMPVRAHVDPDLFVTWCAAHDMDVDARARQRWGNEVAHRAIQNKGAH